MGRESQCARINLALILCTSTCSHATHTSTQMSQSTSMTWPLVDGVYIRTYIPRNPKDFSIKSDDMFHIHDEPPPVKFRSFWVSRLSADGIDEQVGATLNSMKAQEYIPRST